MELHDAFFNLFKGLHRAYGVVELGNVDSSKGKRKGKFQTIHGTYTSELWKKHLAGEQSFGVVPINDDFECYFGAIDIDVYPLDFTKLEQTIAQHNFPLVLCKSKSGGAHLYMFTSEAVSAGVLRTKLTEISIFLGYKGVEVFPKQITLASKTDVGNWLNMPYFNADKTDRFCIFKGECLSAEDFLKLAERRKVQPNKLQEIVLPTVNYIKDGPVCLEIIERNGGIYEGGRNKGLFNVGVYFKKAFPDTWEDLTEEFNRVLIHPPLNSKEVQIVISSLKKKEYIYQCNEDPLAPHCRRAECLRRKHGIAGAQNDIGISINALVKVETNPPTWCIDIDGKRVDSLETDFVMKQDLFRKVCLESLNILPTRVKSSIWDGIIQELLNSKLELLPAPIDASQEGQLEALVQKFVSEYQHTTVREAILEGTPVFLEDESKLYFSSTRLLFFLEKEKFKITPQKVYSMLRKWGCLHGEWNVKGRCVRWWSLPFDGKLVTFTQPTIRKPEF